MQAVLFGVKRYVCYRYDARPGRVPSDGPLLEVCGVVRRSARARGPHGCRGPRAGRPSTDAYGAPAHTAPAPRRQPTRLQERSTERIRSAVER